MRDHVVTRQTQNHVDVRHKQRFDHDNIDHLEAIRVLKELHEHYISLYRTEN